MTKLPRYQLCFYQIEKSIYQMYPQDPTSRTITKYIWSIGNECFLNSNILFQNYVAWFADNVCIPLEMAEQIFSYLPVTEIEQLKSDLMSDYVLKIQASQVVKAQAFQKSGEVISYEKMFEMIVDYLGCFPEQTFKFSANDDFLWGKSKKIDSPTESYRIIIYHKK
jgi:hypothetical protein